MFWFLFLVFVIFLNNLRNLFIFCINIDIDKMLLLNQSKNLGSFRVALLCNSWKGLLVCASYLAK